MEPLLLVLVGCAGLAIRWRLCVGWGFAGSDSYGYARLADELVAHHRYALAHNEPLYWARPPLYAFFLALVHGGSGNGLRIQIGHVQVAQAILDVVAGGALAWATARKLGGRVAGVVAAAFVCLWPITFVFAGAVLTETLAMTLTLATVAPLALLRGRGRWLVSGAMVALSTLLRADGIFLALVPATAAIFERDWRTRARAGALALAAFALVWAPWPLRNLARFGAAHPFGAHLDRFSRPVEHPEGYWRWLASWADDWRPFTSPQACFFDGTCTPATSDLAGRGAFDRVDDRRRVDALFAMRRLPGLAREISDGFSELARERRRREPLRVLVWLPLSRAGNMWVAPHSEILSSDRLLPWPTVMRPLRDRFWELSLAFVVLVAAAALRLVCDRERRAFALALLVPMVARTLFLGWTAYCIPRYAVEGMALGFLLVAVAVGRARAPLTLPWRR